MMFFFFNDTATTEIYTLSLHDALPICCAFGFDVDQDAPAALEEAQVGLDAAFRVKEQGVDAEVVPFGHPVGDRKSTRLNSSHANISYAVFCLKKKKKKSLSTSHYITSS